jgi:hypothetical protein
VVITIVIRKIYITIARLCDILIDCYEEQNYSHCLEARYHQFLYREKTFFPFSNLSIHVNLSKLVIMSKTSFESIAPYLEQIESGFKDKISPEAIAKSLCIPDKARTIRRYKIAVWDLKDLVSESKEERAQKHDSKRESAKEEIINTLDLINLGKKRSRELLSINLGDEFETGEGTHKLTLGAASVYWPIGTKMLNEVARLEMELAGDDPESRKADAIESLTEKEIDARLIELTELSRSSKT